MVRFLNSVIALLGFAVLAGVIGFFIKDQSVSERTIRAANESVADLETRALTKPFDQAKNELARQRLNKALALSDLDPRKILYFRFYRARAIALISDHKKLSGKSVDQTQVSIALSDLDYVLSNDEGSVFENAGYLAGLIAYHHATDPKRAGAYITQCAIKGHAGCMNVAADGHFSGWFGLEQDYQAAIDYHTAVFDTGAKYTCAGSFSARELAMMAYFLPQYEYRYSWSEWLEQAANLQNQAAQTTGFRHICGPAYFDMVSYLLMLHGERHETDLLEGIAANPSDYVLRNMALYFLERQDRSNLDRILSDFDGKSPIMSCRYRLMVIMRENIISGAVPTPQEIRFMMDHPEESAYCLQWLSVWGLLPDEPMMSADIDQHAAQ